MNKSNLKMTYCMKCKKQTDTNNISVKKNKKGVNMMMGTCAVCGCKKSKLISKQHGDGLLSMIGILPEGNPLSKIPLIGDLIF